MKRDFVAKTAIDFVSKLIIFQKVESDTSENLGWPRFDDWHASRNKCHYSQIVFQP